MRGKELGEVKGYTETRITPAYAGKRKSRIVLCKKVRDHPRLCGEKFRNDQIGRSIQGSPPPMRGKGFTSDLPNK